MPSARQLIKALLPALIALTACSGEPTEANNATKPSAPTVRTCPPPTTAAASQPICIQSTCGNGLRDADEACDDGNRIDGDGCSADCRSTEQCGNGVLDARVGEVCDDGNTLADATCCADCRSCPQFASTSASPQPELHSAPRPETEPACNPAELRHALAQLDGANVRADQALADASEAIKQARTASQRASQASQIRPPATSETQRIRDLEAENADLHAQLRAARQHLARIAATPPNGRTMQLD